MRWRRNILAALSALVFLSGIIASWRQRVVSRPTAVTTQHAQPRVVAPLPVAAAAPPGTQTEPVVAPPHDLAVPPDVMPTEAEKAAGQRSLADARAAGLKTGLGAFHPPGTSPLKRGIVVPDGFALPDGYVRHYQVTDSGEKLVPILMYRPGFKPVDAQGRPVSVPADLIVPVEQAPAGLPLTIYEPPT